MSFNEETFDNFLYYVQKITDEYYEQYETQSCKITVKYGRKFAKIIKVTVPNGGTSVHSFVELATGDVYKAASWKAPAKHVRANIYDYESLKRGVSHHGANYLV
jgi:hypothetical protein